MALRQLLRGSRENISVEQRKKFAWSATEALIASPLFQQSLHIASYLAKENEFDTNPIHTAIWQAKKNSYVPMVSSYQDKSLIFVEYQQNTPLILNQYRILEPQLDKIIEFPVQELDLVLVPLLAYDDLGHRLGTGGGYYDRVFSFLQQSTNKKPVLIGLAYQQQQVAAIPAEQWDLKLDGVLTETGLEMFKKSF